MRIERPRFLGQRSGYRDPTLGPWYQRITRTQVGIAVAVVLLLLLGVFALQAMSANQSLRLAANQAEVLQNQIVSGDDEGAKVTLTALQQSTEAAHSKTDGLLWDIGSHVPYFGKNVSAVQTISEVVDGIATDAMPPLVGLSNKINLNTFSPRDGKINLEAVRQIRPSILAADKALAAANTRLEGIDANSLLVPIRGPVASIQFKIKTASSAASSSDTAAKLLPSMLGGNGTRRYLLLIQTNAEVRPQGGIPGSFAILKASKGRLSMGQQGSNRDIPFFSKPVLPMTAGEKAVYPPTMVQDFRDTNFTPDFPRTAEIARAMVEDRLDQKIDGVISVDPVALSYLLEGTGPVVLSSGVALQQDNAVDVLLNGIYRNNLNNDAQDEIFKSAARTIFDVIKDGRGQPRLTIGALVRSAAENRLAVWATRQGEEAEIRRTTLSGAVGGDDGTSPHVGVYLSDAASTKMEYYLDYTTAVRAGRCLDDGIQEINTTTELTSNAPSNAADLPESVTGDGRYTPRGTMSLIVRAYSPYQGGFTEVRVNGKPVTVYADRHLGRNVTRVSVQIKPGQTYTVTTSMISGKDQTGDIVFSTTPGVQSTLNDVTFPSAC